MRDFTAFMLCAATALSAFAVAPNRQQMPVSQDVASAYKATASMRHAVRTAAPTAALPTRASADDVITNPKGERKLYSAAEFYFYVDYGSYMGEYTTSVAKEFYFDGDDVYIMNPFAGIQTMSAIKGTKQGDKIVFPMPQTVIYSDIDDELFIVNADLVEKKEVDGELFYFPMTNEGREFVMTINEDGTITSEPTGYENEEDGFPKVMLGLVEATENEWFGYADSDMTCTLFTEVPNAMPEGLETEQWVVKSVSDTSGEYGFYCNVGIDGDKIYISGLSPEFPEVPVIGTIADGKVTFEAGQYIGQFANMFIHFVGGKEVLLWDDYYEEEYIGYQMLDKVTLDYDAAAKKLSSSNPKQCMVFNTMPDRIYYLSLITNPTIYFQPEVAPAAPQKPEFMEVWPYEDDYGYGYFAVNIPCFDANGNFLNPDNIYYNVYVDDEIFVFDSAEYWGLEEDEMENIPYNFTDDYDFIVEGAIHTIYFYFDGADTIGVQSVYVAEDGTEYKSEMSVYDFNGINSTLGDKTPVSVEYFNLQGIRVANPENGLYIVRNRYEDGSVKSAKVFVRK